MTEESKSEDKIIEELRERARGSMYRVIAKVVHQEGFCAARHKVGDEFEVGQTLAPRMCIWALQAIFPFVSILWFGGTFPWGEPDPDKHEEPVACPDGTNPNCKAKVIFTLRREQMQV
ncbi:MAG: hypothetical protein DRH97_02660 [Chloroflexi bacterium]|nr:MAG: hypothetical protein DRH97_02660 [Chloroflexota bacterium]